MEKTRAHVFVSGKVQGVYYRANTQEAAREKGIGGWVRNLDDGRVEAVFEGEKDGVEAIVEWCHKGSRRAEVEDAEVEWEVATDEFDGFEVGY